MPGSLIGMQHGQCHAFRTEPPLHERHGLTCPAEGVIQRPPCCVHAWAAENDFEGGLGPSPAFFASRPQCGLIPRVARVHAVDQHDRWRHAIVRA